MRKEVFECAHYYVDKEQDAIVFYDYASGSRLPLLGTIFFVTFFLIWVASIVSLPLIVWATLIGQYKVTIGFVCLSIYTYMPIPRRISWIRLKLFLGVPQYFSSASYRVLGIKQWPELECLASALSSEEQATGSDEGDVSDGSDDESATASRGDTADESGSRTSATLVHGPEIEQRSSEVSVQRFSLEAKAANRGAKGSEVKGKESKVRRNSSEAATSTLGGEATDCERASRVDAWKGVVLKDASKPRWSLVNILPVLRSLKVPGRIWLFHPHGLNGCGWGVQAFNPYFHNLEMCISTALYYTPLVVCYTSHCGKPSPVDSKTIRKHLQAGRSVAIILGGFEEATIHTDQTDRIYLKNRTGIFKYALQYGAQIVPVFTFGESRMYSNLQGFWRLRLWLNSIAVPAILPWGRSFIPWCPRQDAMFHVVVGEPLQVQKNPTPRPDAVMALHSHYTTTLTALYDRFKTRFYGPDYKGKLEIW